MISSHNVRHGQETEYSKLDLACPHLEKFINERIKLYSYANALKVTDVSLVRPRNKIQIMYRKY